MKKGTGDGAGNAVINSGIDGAFQGGILNARGFEAEPKNAMIIPLPFAQVFTVTSKRKK